MSIPKNLISTMSAFIVSFLFSFVGNFTSTSLSINLRHKFILQTYLYIFYKYRIVHTSYLYLLAKEFPSQ